MSWRGWVCALGMAASAAAHAQQGPIEATWVYTTQLHWKHAPRQAEVPVSTSSALVVILYPEGRYFEMGVVLIKQDRDQTITFSAGDGHVIRTGTWSRTDEDRIRIQSHVVLRDVARNPPHEASVDTCALEGASRTHLANVLHCHRAILGPAKANLDLAELQHMADAAEYPAAR